MIVNQRSSCCDKNRMDETILRIIVIPPVRIQETAAVSEVSQRVDKSDVRSVKVDGNI